MKTLIKHLNLTHEEAVLEVNRLQQENEQLKELLRLAVNSLTDELTCISCAYHDSDECDLEENCNYKWQHSDKLKGLIEI